MKTAKELADLAFKFAENMINMKRKSLESGNLSDEEKAQVEADIQQFEDIKAEYESQVDSKEIKFSADCPNCLKVFMTLRALIASTESSLPLEVTDLLEKLNLKEIGDAITAHQSHLKGEEFDEESENLYKQMLVNASDQKIEVEPQSVESVVGWLETLIPSADVIKFAAESDGLDCIKSAVNFLAQIKERMENAEHPDDEAIAEYDKAIHALDTFLEDPKVEQFSARTKKFAACLEENPEFCSQINQLEDEGYGTYLTDSITENGMTTETWRFTNSEYEYELQVVKTAESFKVFDEDTEINVEDLASYVKNQLEDININLIS